MVVSCWTLCPTISQSSALPSTVWLHIKKYTYLRRRRRRSAAASLCLCAILSPWIRTGYKKSSLWSKAGGMRGEKYALNEENLNDGTWIDPSSSRNDLCTLTNAFQDQWLCHAFVLCAFTHRSLTDAYSYIVCFLWRVWDYSFFLHKCGTIYVTWPCITVFKIMENSLSKHKIRVYARCEPACVGASYCLNNVLFK